MTKPALWCNGRKHVARAGGYWRHFCFGGAITMRLCWVILTSLPHLFLPSFLPFVADAAFEKIALAYFKSRGYTLSKETE